MKQFHVDTSRMTNGELADLIHELHNELNERRNKINTGNWLTDQLDSAALEVRSWSMTKQRNMRRSFR